MKPSATVDTKPDMKTTEMTPVQVVEKEMPGKKGVTWKHVVLVVIILLTVAVVVGGFVVGFHMLKQMSEKHTENMTKMFKMKITGGKTVVNEKIKTNVYDKTTEVDTKDDKGQDAIVYNDFKRGLTVIVFEGGNGVCYVSPMNKSNIEDPEMLEKYMKTHPNPNVDERSLEKQEYNMVPAKETIPDTTFLGPKVNKMCSGKDVYWMYPDQQPGKIRQKRGWIIKIKWCRRRVCVGILFWRRCWYIRYPCGIGK